MQTRNSEHSLEQLVRIGHSQNFPEDAYNLHEKYFGPADRQQFANLVTSQTRTAEQIQQLCNKEFFNMIFQACKQQRETDNFTKLSSCISSDIVFDVLKQFIKQTIDLPNVQEIILKSTYDVLNTEGLEECMIDGKVQIFYPPNESLINRGNKPQLLIIGDTHGTIEVIDRIFSTYGFPGEPNSPIYVFNGDYVDRGSFGVEIFILLCICKISHPEKVFLTRGNHESRHTCSSYSFLAEVFLKYSDENIFRQLFDHFIGAFMTLPLAVSINHSILILHGGVNPGSMFLTDALQKVERRREPLQEDCIFTSDPLNDFLWCDPSSDVFEALFNIQRQTGAFFGRNGVTRALDLIQHNVLIRSHTCCDAGYERHHDGRTWTVFSVPNYADTNVGAVLEVQNIKNEQQDVLQCAFNQFMVSEYSAIDKQIFFNQTLISEYANLTQTQIKELSNDSVRQNMFFALFSMGYMDANIGSPKSLNCLICKEGIKINLPVKLQSRLGHTKLIDAVHNYLTENQMEITELLSTYEWKEQADAVILIGIEQSLQELGLSMPKGLYNSSIPQKELEKIMEKAIKAVQVEEKRREKRRLIKERRQKQRQKNQKKVMKKEK